MIVYFAERHMDIIGLASTCLPEGLTIVDDNKTEDVETGSSSFELTVSYDAESQSKVLECCEVGNYLLRQKDSIADTDGFYTIIETSVDTKAQEINIYAEDAGLDLLNEICSAYEAPSAQNVAFYVNRFSYDSGFEIGINEIPSLTRKLKWDGESTATERLVSVATQFDCEMSFSFEIDGLRVKHKYINIYRKRGQDSGVNLYLNKHIDKIGITQSIANLATALKVTGGTPEGSQNPITLNGYSYDDGDCYLDGTYIKSRKAVAKWSRYLAESGNYTGHILRTFTYDTTSQSELCNRAVTELKKICVPAVNYEIDIKVMPENISVGDYINIVDDAGGTYISARILKMETSVTNDIQKVTLGDYLIRSDGISQKVLNLADSFAATEHKAINAVATANSVVERANNGEFDGAQGPQGPAGEAGATGAAGPQGPQGPAGEMSAAQIAQLNQASANASSAKNTADSLSATVIDQGERMEVLEENTVTYTDLSTPGATVITGDNITTGTIDAVDINGSSITGSRFFTKLNSPEEPALVIDNGKIVFFDDSSHDYETDLRSAEIYAKNNTLHINTHELVTDLDVDFLGDVNIHSGGDVTISGDKISLAPALPISSGGTGATTAAGALSNLGAATSDHTHTHRSIELQPAVGASHGGFIDFHYGGSTADFTSRIIEQPQGVLSTNNTCRCNTLQNTSGSNIVSYFTVSGTPHIQLGYSGAYMYLNCNNGRMDVGSFGFRWSNGTSGSIWSSHSDGKGALGNPSQRWNSVYATSGAVSTSDRRKKKDISENLDAYLRMMARLTPVRFRYNDIAEDKIRFGFIAQDVEAAALAEGVCIDDAAFLRKEQVDDKQIPDGILYELVYSEFIPLNTAMIQNLQKENDELKKRLTKIEERLGIE